MTTLRLGTRGSQLALWQSNWVKQQLESRGAEVSLVILKTTGDVTQGSLTQFGGQGVFTKRLQDALLQQEVDLAVHSLKDLPTAGPSELTIAAVPPREATNDVLVSPRYGTLAQLPPGATVGTGSVRRKSQLLHMRSDLQIRDIRGNLDTRLQKVEDGEYDAIVLARAGLVRLGWEDRITQVFAPNQMLPAVGQAALGIEIRADDESTRSAVEALSDAESLAQVTAERAMLHELQGGCLAPIGARSSVAHGQIQLAGAVLSPDGQQKIEARGVGDLNSPAKLGQQIAEDLFRRGVKNLL